jgi:hypothetical protein
MDLVDAFFDHAAALVDPQQPSKTEQIDFRRAVSAAYYAVFHLLTMTAAEHWVVKNDRHRFARLFEHNKIKTASVNLPNRLKERLGNLPSEQDRKIADALTFIAGEFIALQQDRHSADYDNSKVWSYTEVENAITRAQVLYLKWNTVRNTPMAQSYLLDMMGRP